MPSVHKHFTFRTSSVTLWIIFANIVHLFGRQLRTRVVGPSEAPVAPSPVQTFRRTIRAVASARGPSWLIQETPFHWSSLNSRWTANSTLQKLRDPIHQQYGEFDIGLCGVSLEFFILRSVVSYCCRVFAGLKKSLKSEQKFTKSWH